MNGPQMTPPPNPHHTQYQTIVCQHWQQNQQCTRNDNCSFAHGLEQLRFITDNITMTENSGQQVDRGPYNGGNPNAQTALCQYYQDGTCKYSDQCTFAHGSGDINLQVFPYQEQYSMPMIQSPDILKLIKSQTMQILNNCLNHYIQHIQFSSPSDGVMNLIEEAKQNLNKGNQIQCAKCICSIVERPNASDTEKVFYEKLQSEVLAIQFNSELSHTMKPMIQPQFYPNYPMTMQPNQYMGQMVPMNMPMQMPMPMHHSMGMGRPNI